MPKETKATEKTVKKVKESVKKATKTTKKEVAKVAKKSEPKKTAKTTKSETDLKKPAKIAKVARKSEHKKTAKTTKSETDLKKSAKAAKSTKKEVAKVVKKSEPKKNTKVTKTSADSLKKIDSVYKKIVKKIGDEQTISLEELNKINTSADGLDTIIERLKNEGYEVTGLVDETEIDAEELKDVEDLENEINHSNLFKNTGTNIPSTDLISLYYADVTKIKLLTFDEEQELAIQMEDGKAATEQINEMLANGVDQYDPKILDLRKVEYKGMKAKHSLIDANYRLVISIAKKYDRGHMSFLDLCQEGSMGLARAADKFDYKKGYKFSTYATWWIRQAIARAIADQGKTIRIPVHMNETISKITKTQSQLTQELGRTPTDEEICARMPGLTEEKLNHVRRIAKDPVSLEQPVGEEEDSILADFISDPNAITPEEYDNKQLLLDVLNEVLQGLTDREERVLRLRFGLYDGQTRTLEEVGNIFSVTRERIRQIENKALKKLKQNKNADKIRKYYELNRKW